MRSLLLLLAMVTACSRENSGDEGPQTAALGAQGQDSLVLRMPDSAEVWFVGSMLDTAATGVPCYERTVEVRRGSQHTPVPLLYTLGEVEVVDDTTIRAALVRDCAEYDVYLVNTKTGQPRRLK